MNKNLRDHSTEKIACMMAQVWVQSPRRRAKKCESLLRFAFFVVA
jgi:hypothetical protein